MPEARTRPRPSTRRVTTTRHQRTSHQRELVVASHKLAMRRPNVPVEIGVFPWFFHLGITPPRANARGSNDDARCSHAGTRRSRGVPFRGG